MPEAAKTVVAASPVQQEEGRIWPRGLAGDVYDRSMARTPFMLMLLAIAGTMALLLGIRKMSSRKRRTSSLRFEDLHWIQNRRAPRWNATR